MNNRHRREKIETPPATETAELAGGNTDKTLFWNPQYLQEHNWRKTGGWRVSFCDKQLCTYIIKCSHADLGSAALAGAAPVLPRRCSTNRSDARPDPQPVSVSLAPLHPAVSSPGGEVGGVAVVVVVWAHLLHQLVVGAVEGDEDANDFEGLGAEPGDVALRLLLRAALRGVVSTQ